MSDKNEGRTAKLMLLLSVPSAIAAIVSIWIFFSGQQYFWNSTPSTAPSSIDPSFAGPTSDENVPSNAVLRPEIGPSEPPPPGSNGSVERPAQSPTITREDNPTPTPPSIVEEVPTSWPLARALVVEDIAHPDKSPVGFPVDHFRQRLEAALGQRTTALRRVRLGVSFVEPRELRARATQGSVIGFLLVSLPDLSGCVRQFGETRAYEFATPQLGIMKAINEQTPQIAEWLVSAVQQGELLCPATF